MARAYHFRPGFMRAFDGEDIEVRRPKVAAFCSSYACTRKSAHTYLPRHDKKKDVSRDTIFCPDCDCALIWKSVEREKDKKD